RHSPPMSRRRSPPRRPPSRGCSRRSSAQLAGKAHSSSCYCYYYHMAATSIPTLERRLRELLRERSVTRGDFTLASGRHSTFYIDARRTTMSGEGLGVIGALGLARLTARGWAPDLVLGVLAVVDREEGGRPTLQQAGQPVEALVTATDLGLR